MSLLDRFKKYINGNNEDDFENIDYELENNEDDNVIFKIENNDSIGNEFKSYNINIEKEEQIEISEEEKKELVKNAIYDTVNFYEDFSILESKAIESSKKIGFEYIDYFKFYINNNLDIKKELKILFKDEEEWNNAVLNTVLIMIGAYREKSIEVFMDIYKENKELRLKVISLLIKLANDVIERSDEIVDFIAEDLLNCDDEKVILILNKLSNVKGNLKAIAVIQYFYKGYLKIGEANKAYRLLVSLVNCAERYTEGHLRFLKALALGNKTINLEKITLIDKGEEKYVTLRGLNDTLKLDATMTYYNLYKEDKDINTILNYLREYSLDLELRERISLIINN